MFGLGSLLLMNLNGNMPSTHDAALLGMMCASENFEE